LPALGDPLAVCPVCRETMGVDRTDSPLFFAYCRLFQQAMRLAAYAMPWRTPQVLRSYAAMVADLKAKGHTSVLVVTDGGLVKAGLAAGLAEALDEGGIDFVQYDKTAAGPTIDDVEEALRLYQDHDCSAIIALGGGSPIDCAKGVAARVAHPDKTIHQLRGQLKVRWGVPYLVAVPTTAGTGSETTVAAVISDPNTHEKFALNDPALIPHAAVLDPRLTAGVPPKVTAATGMDALSHAVEAYIGNSNTAKTRREALIATRLIFENLPTAVADGSNLDARAAMQQAAFRAGEAFTRAYVGYVHAASHQLSGMYGTVHGVGNTVLMPHVLDMYLEPGGVEPLSEVRRHELNRRLAELGEAAGLPTTGTQEQRAEEFIAAIRALAAEIGMPDTLPEIRAEDIPELAKRAFAEGNPLYPVPREFTHADFAELYRRAAGLDNIAGRSAASDDAQPE